MKGELLQTECPSLCCVLTTNNKKEIFHFLILILIVWNASACLNFWTWEREAELIECLSSRSRSLNSETEASKIKEEQYRDQDIHFDLKKEKSSDERSNSVYLLSSACSELLSNIITMGILVGRNVKSWKLRWNCDEICSYLIVHPGVHFFLILTPFVMKDWMKSNYRWDQRERDICCITVSNRHYSTQR